jgi:uncharacterized damage-inducible protein DinB
MNDGDREILDHFTRTREKTKELLRRVPEDWLERTPDGEKYSLGVLFQHTGCGEAWWMHAVMKDGGPQHYGPAGDTDSILERMETARGRVVSFFEEGDGRRMAEMFSWVDENGKTLEWQGRDRLHYFTDHEVHHRGKIVLALRQWGFEDIPFLPY